MSVLEGTIERYDDKVSKAGNPYTRYLIRDDLGNEDWYTSFDRETHAHAGDTVRCEMKPDKQGDGSFIDRITIIAPGDYSMRQQGAVKQQPSSPQQSRTNGTARTAAPQQLHCEDIKQVYIQTSVYFQELYRATGHSQDGCLEKALKMAIHTDRVLSAYKRGGKDAADAAMGNPVKAARERLEVDSQAVQASTDIGEPEHPAFDDDIPF